MSEANVLKLVLLRLSELGARVFRQNTGLAWAGEVVEKSPTRLVLRNPRPLHAGLCKGSSDAIGWTPVVITPEMVGRTVAVFTAAETKSGRGKATDEQLNFVAQVKKAGGIAGVVWTPEQAAELVLTYRP